MHETSRNTAVAYFGIEGSFTHVAAMKYFGADSPFKPCPKFHDVFAHVANGTCLYGVIPIENTLAGSIYENYDLLSKHSLNVIGEILLRIEHSLLVHPSQSGLDISKITNVFSHQKALEQCDNFLNSHPSIVRVPHGDTASAASHIAMNGADKPWAAIAHPNNATLKGLSIMKSNIEDDPSNHTRFLIVSRTPHSDSEANKLSLSLYLPHEPGSLSKVLNHLAKCNANLTKIESRPLASKPFEYVFYLDLTLPKDTDYLQVIESLSPLTADCNVLGFYKSSLDIHTNTQ